MRYLLLLGVILLTATAHAYQPRVVYGTRATRGLCRSEDQGRLAIVKDCTTPQCTAGSGGLAFRCLTYCDGTSWQTGPCDGTTTTTSTSTTTSSSSSTSSTTSSSSTSSSTSSTSSTTSTSTTTSTTTTT